LRAPLKPIKWYKELATSKGRLEASAFLIEGTRAVDQVIVSSPDEIMEILSTDDLSPSYQRYPQRTVTDSQLHSISSTKTPQGIIALIQIPQNTYSGNLPDETGSKILLMEHVQDPGNVGTLIRSAAAFGFSGAILTDKCADPFSPKCVQASAGSILSLWIRRTSNYADLVDEIRRRGYSMVAADLAGEESPAILQRPEKLVLALGNEASGLSASMLKAADHRLRIPIDREKAESLNVAACGAICMYLSCIRKR
jgi:RNA methyltransferase, TrmH family